MEEFLFWYLLIAPVVFLFILYQVIRNAVKWGLYDGYQLRRELGGGQPGPGEPTS